MVQPLVLIETIRQSFVGAEQVYTQGSCIMFYMILKAVYPNARPYWNAESRHMITKIGSKYYDITGQVKYTKGFKLDEGEYFVFTVCRALPVSRLETKRFPIRKKLY